MNQAVYAHMNNKRKRKKKKKNDMLFTKVNHFFIKHHQPKDKQGIKELS
jgi:hypothetical protein